MSPDRRRLAVAALVALAVVPLLSGCPRRRPPQTVPAGDGDVALYRASSVDADGRARRFRLWLWAERPDRLHAEVLTPVGGTALVVDAGGGRLSVADVAERAAFVGAADGDGLARLLGVEVTVTSLVGALLDGREPGGGVLLERAPAGAGVLPERLALRHDGRSLELELRRRVALAPDADVPGSGEPPAGFELAPLEGLGARELPGIDEGAE